MGNICEQDYAAFLEEALQSMMHEGHEIRSLRAYVLARLFDADASLCLTSHEERCLGYSDDEDVRAAVQNMMKGDLL